MLLLPDTVLPDAAVRVAMQEPRRGGRANRQQTFGGSLSGAKSNAIQCNG